jgi:DNA processing protein
MSELSSAGIALALLAADGIGDGTVRKAWPVITRAESIESLREEAWEQRGFSGRFAERLTAAFALERWPWLEDSARLILEKCQRHDIMTLTLDDPMYPTLLKEISDPPVVLYAKGALSGDQPTVAIVGTRRPTEFGERVAKGVSSYLTEKGFTVVSGLALGVDSIGHTAAVDAGNRTVAIFGNGLDRIYPTVNSGLAERILAAGGLLLSEQPPGTEPLPRHLVARDRLQSGMSICTIVVETSTTGGSMHTARFALAQRRMLVTARPYGQFAEEESASGNLALIPQAHFVLESRHDYEHLEQLLRERALLGLANNQQKFRLI